MRETYHTLLGLFVLVGAAILIGGIVLVGGQRIVAEGIPIETVFAESVEGLEVGSTVSFRGVPIGQVDEITLASRYYETQYRYALVRVMITRGAFRNEDASGSIPDQLEQLITEGLRVQLASKGITGVMYLETNLFDPKTTATLPIDWTPAELYVPSVPSQLKQLGESLTKTLQGLADSPIPELVEEARTTMAELRTEVRALEAGARSQEAGELLRRVHEEVDRIGPELRQLAADLRATVQRVDGVSTEAEALLRRIQVEPTLGRMDRFLTEATTTVQRLDQALASAEALVTDQRRGGTGLLENLREVAANLARLTATLEQYPSLLLLGEPPKRDR